MTMNKNKGADFMSEKHIFDMISQFASPLLRITSKIFLNNFQKCFITILALISREQNACKVDSLLMININWELAWANDTQVTLPHVLVQSCL